MSFKNTPITAKIKRTTKGGITQPLLNVGAPVKMKMSSPAKLDPNTEAADFKSKYDAREKAKADKAAQALIAKKASDLSSYKKSLTQYRKDILNSDNAAKTPDGPGFGANALRGRIMKGVSDKKAEAKRILDFENNLYNYDKKHKAGSTDGYTAKEYALAKASDTYKSRATPAETPTPTPTTTPTNGTGTKKSYDQAYKDSRNVKEYAKMSKAEYIKEAKRQNASKKAGKGWDVKGKGKDTPPRKKAVESTITPRKKAVASTVTPAGIKKVEISTKLDPKALKSQVAKVNAKKEPKKEVKKTRSQKLRARGEKALAEGNKKKALRIRRRYDEQVAKETKKKGQASGAIEVKKKTKKQSFNAVTNQSGYDSFKKAGGLSAWYKGEIEVK